MGGVVADNFDVLSVLMDTDQRLQKLLTGAFAGAPTQLKNIRLVTASLENQGAKSLSAACAASVKSALPESENSA
jgi:hypothetical protein